METYRNSWHDPDSKNYGPEFFSTDAKPVEYRGHLIYNRIARVVWDVVKDGVCIGQYAGPNGARRFVDSLS